jgi:hypothetical protein
MVFLSPQGPSLPDLPHLSPRHFRSTRSPLIAPASDRKSASQGSMEVGAKARVALPSRAGRQAEPASPKGAMAPTIPTLRQISTTSPCSIAAHQRQTRCCPALQRNRNPRFGVSLLTIAHMPSNRAQYMRPVGLTSLSEYISLRTAAVRRQSGGRRSRDRHLQRRHLETGRRSVPDAKTTSTRPTKVAWPPRWQDPSLK